MISSSRITKKFQATIPQKIRILLGIEEGDLLGFEVINNQVFVRKVTPIDIEFAKALQDTLIEWNSEADEEAYSDL